MSNRWNLIANRDWRAVLIEGEEARFPDLLTTHGANARVTALDRLVGLPRPTISIRSSPVPGRRRVSIC